MGTTFGSISGSAGGAWGPPHAERRWGMRPGGKSSRVLLVEDDRTIRESLRDLLSDEGFEVALAENGRDALGQLRTQAAPDIIVLDLRMPVMDGWEFRAVQKEDPKLRQIPVVAISADGSPQAVTISAQAYLRKPLDVAELMRTIEGILFDHEWRQMSERLEQAERLASLGRLAAGVGHEINNPLAFSMLNLGQSLEKLWPLLRRPEGPAAAASPSPAEELERMRASLAGVTDMLEDCQVGLERIRQTVGNLQRLSRQTEDERTVFDVRKVIEQSVSMAMNQIRHRARLVTDIGDVPPLEGNQAALGQVFLNLLVNAAQAIPEGNAEHNQIRVATRAQGGEIVIEVHDTGAGIPPEVQPHVFEPFYTTKPVGRGTGLGLSIARQTVADHGGRMEIESEPQRGTLFRVILPATGRSARAEARPAAPTAEPTTGRGRILVIDDEPLIGRIIQGTLSEEHDVFVAHRAADAFARLESGETFDLILCDIVMPDGGGPEVYKTAVKRWPELVSKIVFMTGGAFTPATTDFLDSAQVPVLPKPFNLAELARLVRSRIPIAS